MFSSFSFGSMLFVNARSIFTTACNLRARDCTRAKKRARLLKSRKPITKKQAYKIEKEKRLAMLNQPVTYMENETPPPSDNVYFHTWFKPNTFKFEEAIEMHRETFHPTMLNQPDHLVSVTLELDMRLEKKKNKFMKKIVGVAPIAHKFLNVPDKKVLVITRSEEVQQMAVECGADSVGGLETIKKYQTGALDFTSFSYVLAHPDIADDLRPLRGILKTRFPTMQNGLVTSSIATAVRQFQLGMEFESEQRAFQEHIGRVVLPIGKLSMHLSDLRDNATSIAQFVASRQPANSKKQLITSACVWCIKDGETFRVDLSDIVVDNVDVSTPQQQQQTVLETSLQE